ncbi:hypothetical protein CPAR01_04462 [Colletotrichum paranaense]|uniref:Uncharacterized protein n=1 Tax=Colletotrichum paranaense TaxID=1914294 RepID=A0ABQ9SWE0_9PEZI|nr:hypothetical protein CPAR01_04462 [Colletotrichum paranaense]
MGGLRRSTAATPLSVREHEKTRGG